MTTLFVMLIWVGFASRVDSGAAATIQGFTSIEACQKAIPTVRSFYNGVFNDVSFKCVELHS